MGTKETENEIPISPPQLPPWIELPGDVTANILGRLGAEEILKSAENVCTTWKKVCQQDPAMWRVVDLINPRGGDGRNFDLMCRCAVDRSQGQLTVLSITRFGDDKLLNYVADRSSHLRRLTLSDLSAIISGTALVEAVKKLPQLEELHLIRIMLLEVEEVETIGISCPLLNSFTYDEGIWVRFNCFGNFGEYKDFGIGLAIARTMPNLHHLRIGGFGTRTEGLEAILDGCHHLESLDLSSCYGLFIRKAIRERCSKQIKFLRLPLQL